MPSGNRGINVGLWHVYSLVKTSFGVALVGGHFVRLVLPRSYQFDLRLQSSECDHLSLIINYVYLLFKNGRESDHGFKSQVRGGIG